MAKTKRRIEITVEKHRLVMVNGRNHSTTAWCEACCAQVQMVTPDEAAQLCGVNTRTIYGWIETSRFHFKETENGFSLICLPSIESDSANSTQGWQDAQNQPTAGVPKKSLLKRMLKRS